MKSDIKYYNPDSNELIINRKNIRRALGYPESIVPPWYDVLLEDLIHQAFERVNLQCAFNVIDDVEVSPGIVRLKKTTFQTKKIISGQLKKLDKAVLFLATIGPEFDKWLKSYSETGDTISYYTIDLIGSEMAESLCDWLEQKINILFADKGWSCSNRFSPGYCGWDVAEQHQLFSFFPENACGIKLTESALMQPVKSVSGIMGVGENIRKKDYPCKLCNLEYCYKRHTMENEYA